MASRTPEIPPEYDNTNIIERPDGFYRRDETTGEEFGPFRSFQEAIEEMQYSADSEVGAEDGLHEAEDELGIADWVDPDTGELAEESIPHIEDH
jgi:hypothetical protein